MHAKAGKLNLVLHTNGDESEICFVIRLLFQNISHFCEYEKFHNPYNSLLFQNISHFVNTTFFKKSL